MERKIPRKERERDSAAWSIEPSGQTRWLERVSYPSPNASDLYLAGLRQTSWDLGPPLLSSSASSGSRSSSLCGFYKRLGVRLFARRPALFFLSRSALSAGRESERRSPLGDRGSLRGKWFIAATSPRNCLIFTFPLIALSLWWILVVLFRRNKWINVKSADIYC